MSMRGKTLDTLQCRPWNVWATVMHRNGYNFPFSHAEDHKGFRQNHTRTDTRQLVLPNVQTTKSCLSNMRGNSDTCIRIILQNVIWNAIMQGNTNNMSPSLSPAFSCYSPAKPGPSSYTCNCSEFERENKTGNKNPPDEFIDLKRTSLW